MSIIRSALAFLALACAEPTATLQPNVGLRAHDERGTASSFTIVGAERTVYVRLAPPRPESAEPAHAFVRRMFASADSADARRLVIDLRGVNGSDARYAVSLVRGIVTRDRFARSGGLYVVVGGESFSPSQRVATLLSLYASPRFVSEVPG